MGHPSENEEFLQKIADNQGIIRKICHLYCDNQADRDDLAQEIIYTLWKGRSRYNPSLKYTTWMYRVALNVAISFYRATIAYKRKLQLAEKKEQEVVSLPGARDDENLTLLHAHVSALSELDRALIILYFEGGSYKEIGEILGITETNVATRLSRIKERLKKEITHTKKYQL